MKQLSFEDRMVTNLSRIEASINNLSHTLESLYNNWKHPIGTLAEHYKEELKEQKEEQRREEELDILIGQNRILIKTVKITLIGIIITAVLSGFDILLRLFNR